MLLRVHLLVCVSEGTSQFGFLELSQSQDLQAKEDIVPKTDAERSQVSGNFFICRYSSFTLVITADVRLY